MQKVTIKLYFKALQKFHDCTSNVEVLMLKILKTIIAAKGAMIYLGRAVKTSIQSCQYFYYIRIGIAFNR